MINMHKIKASQLSHLVKVPRGQPDLDLLKVLIEQNVLFQSIKSLTVMKVTLFWKVFFLKAF